MKKILLSISLLLLTSSIIFTNDKAAASNPADSAENTQNFNQPHEGEQTSNELITVDLLKKNPKNTSNSGIQSEYQACLMFMRNARFKSEADRQAYEKDCEAKRDNSSGRK
jgi:hypothetical protein